MGCSKGECPCGTSSDAFATYDDGGVWCFSCNDPRSSRRRQVSARPDEEREKAWTPIKGHYADLTARGITEETCKKCDYQLGELRDGTRVHIQNIKDENGRLIDQKTRDKKKNFKWIAGSKYQGLVGSWSWPASGKSVVITEGEIDRMSVSQAFDNKWPTGSLAERLRLRQEGHPRRLGQAAARSTTSCCASTTTSRDRRRSRKPASCSRSASVKIMTVPDKDANETLLKSGPAPIVRAFWDAKPFRPDGIREGREFTKERLKQEAQGLRNAVAGAQRDVDGPARRRGHHHRAGSGIGKTTIARDLAYHMRVEHGLKIGNIYLEEDNDTSVAAYCALHAGVPSSSCSTTLTASRRGLGRRVGCVVWDGMMFYDHFGSLESERLLTMMRYMAASGCKFIVLDHISIVTSGLESGSEGERKDIDILMTKLASFVKETGCGVSPSFTSSEARGRTSTRAATSASTTCGAQHHRAAVIQRAGGRA
jgi:twinkle protein